MAHINLQDGVPGIRSLVMYRPDTGKPLYDLAQVVLRADSPLSSAEREVIAAYVSAQNECVFCSCSHAAAARYLYQDEEQTVDLVLADYQSAPISDKLKALLSIAESVQKGGKAVRPEQIEAAKAQGATEKEIHDTVLISALFCMCNRYVDGLGTSASPDRQFYVDRGKMRAEEGYLHFDLTR